MEDTVAEDIRKLKDASFSAAFEKVECPSCGAHLALSHRQVFEPHTVSLRVSPAKGSVLGAKTVIGMASSYEELIQAMFDDVCKVETVLMGVDVNDEMEATISIAIVPMPQPQKDT